MYQDPEFIRLNRMCKAYGRDRGETKTKARTGPSLSAVWQEEEYMYAWRDGQWWGTRDAIGDLRPLADILFAEGLIYDDPNAWPENIRRRTFYRPPPPSKRALAI
jgi:hypothetical protein